MNQSPDQEFTRLLRTGCALPAAELNASLRLVWPRLRAPQRTHPASDLVTLFRRAGYVSDGLPQPAQAVPVYRGELTGNAEPGISWTTEAQIARRYAQGYATAGDTRIIRATAPPAAILARFIDDAEVVVVPGLLMDAECLGFVPHFQLSALR